MKTYDEIFAAVHKITGYQHAYAPYIDFEGLRIPHTNDTPDEETTDSVVHITLVVEEGETPRAYYLLRLSTPDGLVDQVPPAEHLDRLRASVEQTVQAFRDVGVTISRVTDETPYPAAA